MEVKVSGIFLEDSGRLLKTGQDIIA
ncbi:uncharacterized protein METZ01_LOCUS285450 [marine metagenome]|uniref:Uncharacterized protein n=1 Tax=marine metagenome TaxID=408172 RepID=A0A382L7C6_9ZZZZ